MPGDPGAVGLHLLHRGLAVLSFVLLGAYAFRCKRPAARVVAVLLFAVILLGMAAVGSGLNLWLVVLHGAVAALLLGGVATLLRR